MDRFTATAGELAAAPATWTLGYCHGSEPAVMQAIAALHATRPDTVVRADGLTSLRILDRVRTGAISTGIVRGPVPESDHVTSTPLARVAVDHIAVPPDHPLAGAKKVRAEDLDGQPVLVVDRAEAPTAHDEITAYCAAGGRTAALDHPCSRAGRAGARSGRPRHRHRLAQRMAGGGCSASHRHRRQAVASGRPVRRLLRRVARRRRGGDDGIPRRGVDGFSAQIGCTSTNARIKRMSQPVVAGAGRRTPRSDVGDVLAGDHVGHPVGQRDSTDLHVVEPVVADERVVGAWRGEAVLDDAGRPRSSLRWRRSTRQVGRVGSGELHERRLHLVVGEVEARHHDLGIMKTGLYPVALECPSPRG